MLPYISVNSEVATPAVAAGELASNWKSVAVNPKSLAPEYSGSLMAAFVVTVVASLAGLSVASVVAHPKVLVF